MDYSPLPHPPLFRCSERRLCGAIVRHDYFYFDIGRFPFGVNKEVVGIRVLLIRSLFACDILRRFVGRVSLAKPTSAALRC